MGQYCPKCELYLPVKQRLTVDQGPAVRASNVVGAKLSCDHIYYDEEYKPFMEKMDKIKSDEAEAIRKLHEDTTSKLSAMWAILSKAKKGKGNRE